MDKKKFFTWCGVFILGILFYILGSLLISTIFHVAFLDSLCILVLIMFFLCLLITIDSI